MLKGFLALVLLCPLFAQAENWVKISPSSNYEIDIESIKVDDVIRGPNLVHFNYRYPFSADTVQTTMAAGMCGDQLFELKRIINSTKGLSPITLEFENDPARTYERFKYVGYTSPESQALRFACEFTKDKDLENLRAKVGCDGSAIAELSCSNRESWRVNFQLFLNRQYEYRRVCGAPEQMMNSLFANVGYFVTSCRDEACGNRLFEKWINLLGKDSISAQDHQRADKAEKPDPKYCTGLKTISSELVAYKAQRDKENLVGEARDSYFKCVITTVPKLDDGISSAEIIAKGAHTACSREFDAFITAAGTDASKMSPSMAEQSYKIVEPKLIEAVLMSRAKKNNATRKNPSKAM